MAPTTTAIHGHDIVLKVDNASNTLTDISGSSNEANLDLDNELANFKVFGSVAPIRIETGKDASLELKLIYTTQANEGLDLLRDWYFSGSGARTIQIDVPNSTAGNDRYTGEFLLENLKIPLKADDNAPIMVSASLKPTGVVAYSTIS